MRVRPATREVAADGAPEALEPRVMQVLVALARRRGEVVSRDELILSCWGGRAVGDDAINRCIARIRRLAENLWRIFPGDHPAGGLPAERGATAGCRGAARAGAIGRTHCFAWRRLVGGRIGVGCRPGNLLHLLAEAVTEAGSRNGNAPAFEIDDCGVTLHPALCRSRGAASWRLNRPSPCGRTDKFSLRHHFAGQEHAISGLGQGDARHKACTRIS